MIVPFQLPKIIRKEPLVKLTTSIYFQKQQNDNVIYHRVTQRSLFRNLILLSVFLVKDV